MKPALKITRDDGSIVFLNKHAGRYEFAVTSTAPLSADHKAQLREYIGDDPEGAGVLAEIERL